MQNKDNTIAIGLASLFLIIFIEGFVSISVEILTIRQLIPVVGNSVIVTSVIIGLFLLFLALGYYRGGFYRKDYVNLLQRNLTYAAVILGVGLSYIFIDMVFTVMHDTFNTHALTALVLYLLIVTAPLIFMLGQTVPITTNLFRYQQHVGSISGNVLFLSTLGSFLGSVFTAAVLMNFFGVAWTVFINYLALTALIILLQFNLRKRWYRLVVVAAVSILTFTLNVDIERGSFVHTNQYGNYRLITDFEDAHHGHGKLLSLNGSASSFLNDRNKGFTYLEMIKKIVFDDLHFRNKDILVIGAGGFSFSAENAYGNHITYNDIDKAIKSVAENGFIDKVNGKFVAEDARKFLMAKHQVYDLIITDVYNNYHSIPFYLLTREHLMNIRSAIKDNGWAIFNIIARPSLEGKYSKRVDNTIRSVFPSCMTIPISFTDIANILYVCKKSDYDHDRTIYTDNLNTVTMDFYTR